MTLSQLEYIIALDKYRNFVKAAQSCGVTQPTLSSLIQKLELELGVNIFDRSSHPISLTEIGEQIVNQAKVILYNTEQLKEQISIFKGEDKGEIALSIIPTVAPYIVPKIFGIVKENSPGLSLKISEMRTSLILEKLEKAEIDMALLATPLERDELLEIPIYYEKFIAYISPSDPLHKEALVDPKVVPLDRMWILEEGHCLRSQVFNFCQAQKDIVSYEAGSIDTLVKIVDANGGFTIIPELHQEFLSESQKRNLRELSDPCPVREISLVIRQDFVKERLLNMVTDAIKLIVPETLLDKRLLKFAVKL